MPISIPMMSKANQIRQPKSSHAYLEPKDLVRLTGIPLAEVENALKRDPKGDRPKSRLRNISLVP